MNQIVPAFLVESKKEFTDKIKLVEQDAKLIQLDVLNGSMFSNTTWWDPDGVSAIQTSLEIELHLMVENPIPIVEEFQRKVPGFAQAIVHAEIDRQTGAVVAYIKDILGLKAGVALNPETPLEAIEEVLHTIDQLTIMGVHPGSSGQTFGDNEHIGSKEAILNKIRQARRHRSDLIIEVDGGVTDELIPELIKAGANRICAASLIFKNENPTSKLQMLNDSIL